MSKNSEYVKKFRRKMVKVVQDWKEAGPCTDCGVAYPYFVMDADHVQGDKAFGLGTLTDQCRGTAAVMAELDKCERVCANCHRYRSQARQFPR